MYVSSAFYPRDKNFYLLIKSQRFGRSVYIEIANIDILHAIDFNIDGTSAKRKSIRNLKNVNT